MKSIGSRKIIKLKSVIKQNSLAFSVVLIWFLGNFLFFILVTLDFPETMLILFYFKAHESLYGNFYANFSEFIIFGVLFSLITIDLFRKYNPVDTCRKLAKSYSNHVVIIGYNHIGQRVAEYLKEIGEHCVIIEKRKEVIQDLIENEQPVINDDALNLDTLFDAGVDKAKAVMIMSDNLEVQFVLNAEVRQINKSCKLICRIFEDDISDLIMKTYNAKIISTSKFAADIIYEKIIKRRYRKILLIGMNHITARLIEKFRTMPNIEYQVIEENEEHIEDIALDMEPIIIGDPKDYTLLKKIKVEDFDYIINLIPNVTESILIIKRIREFNKSCKILARFFNDSVAEILEKAPFNTKVISSSKYTLKNMIKRGLMQF
ncbi:MAG: NAD-binding protein [Candidatus Hodarchaeota archaeon]